MCCEAQALSTNHLPLIIAEAVLKLIIHFAFCLHKRIVLCVVEKGQEEQDKIKMYVNILLQ
jgi:hypothetical protein